MTHDPEKTLKLACLISGSGRTMINIQEKIDKGELNAKIDLVIGSSETSGVEKARELGINTLVIRKKAYDGQDAFSEAMWAPIREAGIELVCLAGFMLFLPIPEDYTNRVMNIHPSLLPAFGGKGMYGHHVHEAVIEHGCKITGCTVHFADNEYDKGPIIVQRACPVFEGETADDVAARVFKHECVAYPKAINYFQQGRIQVVDRRVVIAGEKKH